MAMTRSMTRNQNHDDDHASSSSSSTRKKFKTFDNNYAARWSNVGHDVLFLVMMQLGVVDFIAFSGVCKSWRSYAFSNRNMFMMSKPPMKIRILPYDCYLEDLEERKFKTILPHYSFGRTCFGLTCGYVILFERKTRDFWLVNPITRHELHFPRYPVYVGALQRRIRPILVFSPSISGYLFVMANKNKISFCIAGKRGWNHVSTTLPIIDLHVFKGKIYTLHKDCCLGELRLDPKSKWKGKWTLLVTILKPNLYFRRLVSSNDGFYLINLVSRPRKVMELDFGEMKWVSPEKLIEEYAIFVSFWKYCVAINPKSWVGPWRQQLKSYGQVLDTGESQQGVFCYQGMWYFPHDCLNVD